jgi:hypothetical protein
MPLNTVAIEDNANSGFFELLILLTTNFSVPCVLQKRIIRPAKSNVMVRAVVKFRHR